MSSPNLPLEKTFRHQCLFASALYLALVTSKWAFTYPVYHITHCFASSCYYWQYNQIKDMVWGISIDNVKRCFANRLIHHIVVNKLNMWQYSFPVPLLINTNITQHIFQSSFDYLCLSICLKKEGTTKLQLHVKFILQMMPKLTSELPIPVRINSLWNIM